MADGKKTGGRKAGTPNKMTFELRGKLAAILDKELETLPGTLEDLDARERVEAVLKLAAFVLPKVETVTAKAVDLAAADNKHAANEIQKTNDTAKMFNF